MKETTGDNLLRSGTAVLERLARYLDESLAGEGPVIPLRPMRELMRDLGLERWMREGGMGAEGLGEFLETYLGHTIRMHHPANMGHQVSSPHYAAALADLIHGVVNNPMGIYEMGPSAATTEAAVVRWMTGKLGWAGGGGALTHGGSLANLTALLGARAAAAPEAWENGVGGELAVLAPSCSHYSVARAASILGLGARAVIPLEVDARERIAPGGLPRALARARSEGRRVIAVVANGCATATGLYDPLEAVADFCEKERLWLHVDGAHGLSAILSDRERGLLKGVERADSVIWDMHKMLRVSTLCAAVLFRRSADMGKVFTQKASYIFHEKEDLGLDALHYTLECTKAELGLKLFLVLAFMGEKGLASYVEGQYALARKFHARIAARPGFECFVEPESNILCFRYGSAEVDQLRLRNAVVREGRHYLTTAEVGGRRYLRVTLMVPGTTETELDGLLDAVERLAPAAHISKQ